MRIGELLDNPLFSCVSAAAGTGVKGGVINSLGSHALSMDGESGSTSAAGPSMTAAQSEPKPGTAAGVVPAVSEATSGAGRPGTTSVQTLNGSTVVVNCHIPGGASAVSSSSSSSSQSAVTLVNNGPVPATEGGSAVLPPTSGTAVRTPLTSAQHTVTSPVISCQPSVKSVPTVTLARPPMQTPTITSQSGGSPATAATPPAATVDGKSDSAKPVMQTGNAHVVASVLATGTTAIVRSPTVMQNVRTSVPSTLAATPSGGIRAIAPQVLAPRVTQPQQSAPNIQNIQLPPGNLDSEKARTS